MLALLVIAGSLLGSVSTSAHHRFADTYREDEQVTIEGEVVRWEFGSPHSFVHVLARDPRHRNQRWIVEFRGAGHLRQHGVTADTFKPGQHVVVTGSPGRVEAEHRLRAQIVMRPQDGWKWSDGNS